MAILHWNEVTISRGYHHHLYNFDIYNWRMIRQGRLYIKKFKRDEEGVLISAKEHLRFIPHATISQVLKYNEYPKDFIFDKYHVGYKSSDVAMAYCSTCRGIGKFDWIQLTSPAKKLPYGAAPKNFIRDENASYSYPGNPNYIFAKVKLEIGDVYCDSCHGFGINLDGRFKLFQGMNKIKTLLQPINERDYHGTLH